MESSKSRPKPFLTGRRDHLISTAFGQSERAVFFTDLFGGARFGRVQGRGEFLVAAFRGAGGVGGKEVVVVDHAGVEAGEVGFHGDRFGSGAGHRRAVGGKGVVGGVGTPFELAVAHLGAVGVDDALQGVAALAVGATGGSFYGRFDQRGAEFLNRGFDGPEDVGGDELGFVVGVGVEALGVGGDRFGALFGLDGAGDRVAVGVLAFGGAFDAPVGFVGGFAFLVESFVRGVGVDDAGEVGGGSSDTGHRVEAGARGRGGAFGGEFGVGLGGVDRAELFGIRSGEAHLVGGARLQRRGADGGPGAGVDEEAGELIKDLFGRRFGRDRGQGADVASFPFLRGGRGEFEPGVDPLVAGIGGAGGAEAGVADVVDRVDRQRRRNDRHRCEGRSRLFGVEAAAVLGGESVVVGGVGLEP